MSAHLEQTIERLAIDAEIRGLAARFSDAVNRRDFDAFGDLFADDGIWEIGEPFPRRAAGRQNVVTMFRNLSEPLGLLLSDDAYRRDRRGSGPPDGDGQMGDARDRPDAGRFAVLRQRGNVLRPARANAGRLLAFRRTALLLHLALQR